MILLENKHYMDGFDLWTYFGIGIEKGSYDDFLKIPKRKPSIEHNFLDETGIDIDLSRTFFEARDIQLKCFIVATSESDFWDKYNRFMSLLATPGTRRMTVTALSRDYYVFYKDCSLYDKLTRIRNSEKVAHKFVLTLTEKEPGFNNTPTFLIDENNRFIIT